MFKGALFDLDGVIADTSVYHFQAWKKLIQDNFQQDLPSQLEEQTKGVSRADSLQRILDYLQIEVDTAKFQQLMQQKNEYYFQLLQTLTPDNILPGIKELLQELQQQKVKLALASASLNAPVILEKLQLSDYFAAIADLTAVKQGKPAPDIFLAAAGGINVTPQDCVAFEDSIAGIQAINQAQAFSVGIGSSVELAAADLLFAQTKELNMAQIETSYQQWKEGL
ncbi:beta-phosphoglucomutase [Bombilactobacillus bombi]|uniref:Beta-phosphoglucomutase n=1 Tax=Bombilactobacillus bombi TaxID=1303590 RepID=A0A417Z2L2_9LACO|nr:beta-phosphoglucomutase [Bombilactobacillus bombi]RHW44862.1 beta-phosphoglucomutase [Bombilactobacillus bombi]